jgi:hypothetical protein
LPVPIAIAATHPLPLATGIVRVVIATLVIVVV